jgi:hypothetical protein
VSDDKLRESVEEELLWDPRVDNQAIGVTADHGAVTLRGTVGSFREKHEAAAAAKRVDGVKKLDDRLKVRILDTEQRDDADLRGAVLQALALDSHVPSTIDAKARHGVVTLTGWAPYNFQRDEAKFVAGKHRRRSRDPRRNRTHYRHGPAGRRPVLDREGVRASCQARRRRALRRDRGRRGHAVRQRRVMVGARRRRPRGLGRAGRLGGPGPNPRRLGLMTLAGVPTTATRFGPEEHAGSRPRCIGVSERSARGRRSCGLQGLLAEFAQGVVAALEQLARDRQAGAIAARGRARCRRHHRPPPRCRGVVEPASG